MITDHCIDSRDNCRMFQYFLPVAFSFSGTVIGIFTAYQTDPVFLSMMRRAVFLPVSIVDLCCSILLPFIFTAVISCNKKTYLLLPFSFLKSLTYSLILASTTFVFSSCGWLVRSLLLFTDSIVIALLYWYLVRHINGQQTTAKRDLLVILLLSITTGILDVFFVAPYLAALLNYLER